MTLARSLLILGACVLLFAAEPAIALDPTKRLTQYVHEAWGKEEGLPATTVRAILQTRDGYLWVGTQNGLARFDGVDFVTFNSTNTPELASNDIRDLVQASDGSMWIGTYGGGVVHKTAEGFTAYTTHDGLASDIVYSIYQDRAGDLWAGTASGLSRLREGEFTTYTTDDGLGNDRIFPILEDRDGTLWVGTWEGGLSRFEDGRFHTYTTTDGLGSDIVFDLHEDAAGTLWIATYGGGLTRFEGGEFTTLGSKEGLPDDRVTQVREDRDGNLWIATLDGGLVRLRDGTFSSFTQADGLTANTILALHESADGSLWIGTGGGLNRLMDAPFTSYSSREGLSHNRVYSINETADGAIWIGTEGGGVNRLHGGEWSALTTADGLASNDVVSVIPDRHGSLWFGTFGGGLNRLQNSAIDTYTMGDGLASNIILALFEDRRGTVWIGTFDGLTRLQDGAFTTYTTDDGLGENSIRTIFEDQAGTLWIGTNGGGLSRFDNGRFQSYTVADGLPSDIVYSIHQDAARDLWIGTKSGLARLRDGAFSTYTASDGLSGDIVYSILEDDLGFLWLCSSMGVSRVRKEELNAFADGAVPRITAIPYGASDGIDGGECNGGSQPGALEASDGRFWFPTPRGAVVVDPNELEVDRAAPRVYIEEVVGNGSSLDLAEERRLSPGTGNLEFHYTGLSFRSPDAVRFRYRLEGFDREWIEAGDRRVAYYTNVGPGDYRFRVLAANKDGVWSEAGAAAPFSIQPFFYETWWFYLLVGGTGVLLLVGGYRGRVRRLTARETVLERTVAERTAELREAQKMEVVGRLAGGIAHDFNNLLTAITGHSSLLLERMPAGDPARSDVGEIRRAADRAAALTRQLLAFSRRQVLQPRVLDLNSVISNTASLLQRLIGEDIDLRSQLSPGLAPVEADPGQIEQVVVNLVVNARDALHDGGTITVTTDNVDLGEDWIRRNGAAGLAPGRYVRLSVRDTGTGITPETKERVFEPFFTTKEQGKGTGLGLSTVYGIVKQSGGHVDVVSEVGEGSTFNVYLPAALKAAPESDAGETEPTEPKNGRETILVAEDEEAVRKLGRRILERAGYTVLEAPNGEEALRIAEAYDEPIHLLLTDVIMPGMHGPELAGRLSASRTGIRTLYMSGYTNNEIADRGILAPETAFLEKPFSPAELAHKVRAVLDDGAADMENAPS